MTQTKHPDLVRLPQTPGYYFGVMSDWGYLDVVPVHVSKDSDKHKEYLRGEIAKKGADKVPFYLYAADNGDELTMYYDAHDHKPPVDAHGKPFVDGYREFNFWWLVGGTEIHTTEPALPAS